MKKIRIILLLLLYSGSIIAQTDNISVDSVSKSNLYGGIELGFNSYSTNVPSYDFIRSQVGNQYESESLQSIFYHRFAGAILDYALSDVVTISGGIRYSMIYTSIGNNIFSGSKNDYFYLLLDNNNLDTYYYRINNITQNATYVGIPLEFRAFTKNRIYGVRIFGKVGTDLSFKVSDTGEVDFYNQNMKTHQEEVLELFNDNKSVMFAINIGGGIQVGNPNSLNLRMDFNLPSIFVNGDSFNMANPSAGAGILISFLMPLNFDKDE